MHQTDYTSLGSFELTQSCDQPAETNRRMTMQFRQESVSLEAKGPYRADCFGGRDIWGISKHRNVAQYRPRTDAGDDSAGPFLTAVDLDLAVFDQIGSVRDSALLEQMSTGVLRDDLACRPNHFDIGAIQRRVVRTAEGSGQPVEVLLFSLSHPRLQPSPARPCSKGIRVFASGRIMGCTVARHRAPQLGWLWGGFGTALLFLFVSGAWAGHIAGAGEFVAPNVEFMGTDLSGASAEKVESIVRARSRLLLSAPIAVDTGEGLLVLPAEDLGFEYAVANVADEIKLARYEGGLATTLLHWLTSPFAGVEIHDEITFDPMAARSRLETLPELTLALPVEPRLTTSGTNYLYLVDGVNGIGIDIGALVEDLSEVELTQRDLTILGEHRALLPSVTNAYADEIGERLNELTATGMEVIVGDSYTRLTTAQLRRHLEAIPMSGRIQVAFDVAGLHAELERAINGPVGQFNKPQMDIVDGDIVVLEPGEPAPFCCELDSVRVAAEGILAGDIGPWHLESRESDDASLAAWADGSLIVDKVGEFTTSHSCCQPRVANIQRMADLVRGTYLVPGDSLSLNRKVTRTRANGFVADGAIRFGRLTNEVGGGVSQFATTIFNAAYFAGLDFEEYRSHSIYFRRYPFGREATVSSPSPDLVIANTTDYPVLIWTSYDSRNITVTMYSTQNVDVVELGQRVSSRSRCTYVETDRQRTYEDGREVVDTVTATYRPAEGLDCNGNRIIPPDRT